ncbi:MAG: hypothetical protein HYX28_05725 [Candidatus Koribacter versatilis]|uniref:Uncharacterized protein n=1 Tax=Candidatus Korobacter versatilis TaxID=658062 RepID=A0A932A7Q6_9BACT|nr:hypothetical protein [Candidatus Koribacter versatilis]
MNQHPLIIALLVVAAVAIAGFIIAMFRGKNTFSGYEDLAPDARAIAKALKDSEVFRDGGDLVVSGNFQKLPTIVRFSYEENTPALNIHMKAPATFTLSVVPKGARATEGRVLVKTPDDMFDARFTTRSDNPTQAKMFTSGKSVMQALQKVCCSSKTFFTVTPGAVELSELTMPAPYTARHVSDHIGMMGQLARELGEMPGSETVKIRALQREGTSWILRGAVALGVIAAIVTIVAATQDYGKPAPMDIGRDAQLPAGVLPVDAQAMTKLDHWRVAQESDFSGAALTWLRDNDEKPAGRMGGDFTGFGGGTDAAYLLINEDSGKRRIVLVGHGNAYYDVGFDKLDGIAVLPHRFIDRVEWAAPLALQPDGDGLVLVLDGEDAKSAIVLFLKDRKLISAKPVNYQRMRLE